MRWLVICLVLATLPAFHVVAAQEPKLLQEFTLKEHFGVTLADQVVVFELKQRADLGQCCLLDDAGKKPGEAKPATGVLKEVKA